MNKTRTILLLITLLSALLLALPIHAQVLPNPPNPNANISWPPPGDTISGDFTIRGSANLPNQSNYFIEYQAVPEFNPDLEVNPLEWLPATAPNASAVQDGILGVWDTTLADDGVYALRLTVKPRPSR